MSVDFLTRERSANRALIKPLLDTIRPCDNFEFGCFPFTCSHGEDGEWYYRVGVRDVRYTNREQVEEFLLQGMQLMANTIKHAGHGIEKISGYDTFLYKSALTLATDGSQPLDGPSFLNLEDQYYELKGIVEERSHELQRKTENAGVTYMIKTTGFRDIRVMMQCLECWIKRLNECDVIRQNMIAPAQLAMAEDVLLTANK
jgi:hypothetical protein